MITSERLGLLMLWVSESVVLGKRPRSDSLNVIRVPRKRFCSDVWRNP